MTRAKLLEIFREGYEHGVRFGLIVPDKEVWKARESSGMGPHRDQEYFDAWDEGFRAARLAYLAFRKKVWSREVP